MRCFNHELCHTMTLNLRMYGFLCALVGVFSAGDVLARNIIIPSPPQLAAKAYVLMDANTGHVLIEESARLPLPPASLTKIMTS